MDMKIEIMFETELIWTTHIKLYNTMKSKPTQFLLYPWLNKKVNFVCNSQTIKWNKLHHFTIIQSETTMSKNTRKWLAFWLACLYCSCCVCGGWWWQRNEQKRHTEWRVTSLLSDTTLPAHPSTAQSKDDDSLLHSLKQGEGYSAQR